MINTIHCRDGIPDDWRDGARLADGKAISIINRLNTERNTFVAEKQKQLAAQTGQKTLDQALVEAIRSQATQKRFIFEEAGL
jgi:hypothetical protein